MGQGGPFTHLARICMSGASKLTALLRGPAQWGALRAKFLGLCSMWLKPRGGLVQGCQLYTCEASYIKTKEMAQSSHEIKHAISGGLLRSVSVGRSPPARPLCMQRPCCGVRLM